MYAELKVSVVGMSKSVVAEFRISESGQDTVYIANGSRKTSNTKAKQPSRWKCCVSSYKKIWQNPPKYGVNEAKKPR